MRPRSSGVRAGATDGDQADTQMGLISRPLWANCCDLKLRPRAVRSPNEFGQLHVTMDRFPASAFVRGIVRSAKIINRCCPLPFINALPLNPIMIARQGNTGHGSRRSPNARRARGVFSRGFGELPRVRMRLRAGSIGRVKCIQTSRPNRAAPRHRPIAPGRSARPGNGGHHQRHRTCGVQHQQA